MELPEGAVASAGSPLGRAVCRTCWTWYANGESVCPKCHTRLVGAENRAPSATPAPVLVQPSPDAPFPAPATTRSGGSSGISWPIWLLIGGGALAVIAVVGLLVLGLRVTGALGPVASSNGAITVKVPNGWAQGNAAPVTTAKPVLALASLQKTNGVAADFVVADLGQSVPLSTIEADWDPVLRSGRVTVPGTLGALRRTTVAGAPALVVDFHGSKYSGQLLFVDYGNTTYIVEMASDPSEFDRLRDGDFSAILASWQWQ
jgi:hypothetical protein